MAEIDHTANPKKSLPENYRATLSNKDIVEKIKAVALPLLSSSTMPINDTTLKPIFTYTDQLIKNKASTGKDGVIDSHHFINIAKTIELLRKISHVLDPKDSNNKKNVNSRIQLLFNNINHRDKNELIQQIKEGKGRFNNAEKSVIKDIINDYYFSSHANSYMEPLFYIKRDILGAIEKMGSEQSSNQGPLRSAQSAVTITEETNISPQISEIVDKPAEIQPLQNNSTTPVIAEENPSQILPTTDDIQDVNINQTPSFFENLSNSISYWLRWLFSDLWN